MPDSQNTVSPAPQGGQGFPADNHRDGTPGLVGKDDFTIAYETSRLQRGRQDVLAGNYADLQRLGAQVATGTINPQTAIVAPVDPKSKDVVTPAQHDAAKGEATVESIRAGLISAPTAPAPKGNKDPDSIDPTSVSPTSATKK